MVSPSPKAGVAAIALSLLFVSFLVSGCVTSVDHPEIVRSVVAVVGDAATLTGDVVLTRDGGTYTDVIDVTLYGSSSVAARRIGTAQGHYYLHGANRAAMLSGDYVGDDFVFTGINEGTCAGTCSGRVTSSGGWLSLEMEGEDCEGTFGAASKLQQTDCWNLEGSFFVVEEAEIIFRYDGQFETQTQDGSGLIELSQTSCVFRMNVPGYPISRTGSLSGSTLSLAGPFVASASGNMMTEHNEFSASVDILNLNDFTFTGQGFASGTIDGRPFTCEGYSSAHFRRLYDVAVAVLRGGPIGEWEPGSSLDRIRQQAELVDPRRVITHGVPTINQIEQATNWFNGLCIEGVHTPKLVMVGHSLGGYAVWRSRIPGTVERVTIDPIDPFLLLLDFDQRNYNEPYAQPVTGRNVNLLAEFASLSQGYLLGYQIPNADVQRVEPNTDHASVVDVVYARNTIHDEVHALLTPSSGFSHPSSLGPMSLKAGFRVICGWESELNR